MSKIARFGGNLQAFAIDQVGTERTVFGDVTQSDVLDDNINTDYRRGWGIVGVNENPTKQDFNALGFTHGQLLAYLHQVGIPEWHTSQEYHVGSLANRSGRVFRSLINTNTGNDPLADDGTNWTAVKDAVQSQGVIAPHMNLVIANNTVTPLSQVDIDADELLLTAATGDQYLASAVNLTVDITTSGANGLDTGAEANSTWYHLWAIWNPTTDTVAGLMSISATAPTLPSGYTYQGYVGAIYNGSGGDLIDIDQQDTLVKIANGVLTNGSATAETPVSLATTAPVTAREVLGTLAIANTSSLASNATVRTITGSNLGQTVVANPGGTANIVRMPFSIAMDASQTLYYFVNLATSQLNIVAFYWRF